MSYRLIAAALLAFLLVIPGCEASTKNKEKNKAELRALRHDPAYRNGYDNGYSAGSRDSQGNSSVYNDEGGAVFDQADEGYTPQYGDKEKYQKLFRMGYLAGYKAGWDFAAGRYAPFGPGK